jgi:hypothetical protein
LLRGFVVALQRLEALRATDRQVFAVLRAFLVRVAARCPIFPRVVLAAGEEGDSRTT